MCIILFCSLDPQIALCKDADTKEPAEFEQTIKPEYDFDIDITKEEQKKLWWKKHWKKLLSIAGGSVAAAIIGTIAYRAWKKRKPLTEITPTPTPEEEKPTKAIEKPPTEITPTPTPEEEKPVKVIEEPPTEITPTITQKEEKPTKAIEKPPRKPIPEESQKYLKNISSLIIDYKNQKPKLKEYIGKLSDLLFPYRVEIEKKPTLKLSSTNYNMLLANVGNIQANEIKKDVEFSLELIKLIDMLFHIELEDIPGGIVKQMIDKNKEFIKEKRLNLLAEEAIKLAYLTYLTTQQNPQAIIQLHSKISPLDNKIYKVSATASPADFSLDPLTWVADSKNLGKLTIVQIPTLSQQKDAMDATNYCGFYAMHFVDLLQNIPEINQNLLKNKELLKMVFQEFINRGSFITFFKQAITFISEQRHEAPGNLTDLGEYEFNIPYISRLGHAELIILRKQTHINAQNLILGNEYAPDITIKKITKRFIQKHANDNEVQRHSFVGATHEAGSHWMAFSLEKHNWQTFMLLADSLCQNRQKSLERWFSK
jgi:hypothetical protein